MSKRPKFTIAQVVDRFAVSQSTLRRGITSRRFPGATKDHAGRWVIPVDDVLNAGYKPRKTWFNEGSHDHGQQPSSPGGHNHGQGSQTLSDANKQAVVTDHGQLENELAHERAQVDKLKALLDAERAHVESLRMALRMIEPGTAHQPKEPTTAAETSAEHARPEPATTPSRTPRPRKSLRLFRQFFKNR